MTNLPVADGERSSSSSSPAEASSDGALTPPSTRAARLLPMAWLRRRLRRSHPDGLVLAATSSPELSAKPTGRQTRSGDDLCSSFATCGCSLSLRRWSPRSSDASEVADCRSPPSHRPDAAASGRHSEPVKPSHPARPRCTLRVPPHHHEREGEGWTVPPTCLLAPLWVGGSPLPAARRAETFKSSTHNAA